MPMINRAKWAETQIRALTEMGDTLADAERFVRDALAKVPEGEDPAIYLPPPVLTMADAEITSADIMDARADWYASEDVPGEYKRLLDAVAKETL